MFRDAGSWLLDDGSDGSGYSVQESGYGLDPPLPALLACLSFAQSVDDGECQMDIASDCYVVGTHVV